jgi:hypothetical protein
VRKLFRLDETSLDETGTDGRAGRDPR